jgi:uncharacterized protein YecE (DUF72 family)
VSAKILLGCQGWAYPDWVGSFYPPGAKQESLLPFYARVFDTVELDNTFYHPPKASIARSWAKHTPAHFRFAAKVPRAITHDAGLRGVADQMQDFARAMEPLGEKLGPLLVQLPAEFMHTPETFAALDGFLREAPAGTRLAVEFRHRSWQEDAVVELLRERGASLAWTEWRELPRYCRATTPFLYLRWLGDRRAIERYDRVQVDRSSEFVAWEEEVRRAAGAADEIYGYFNNHWAGHSPASVNEFKRRLGLPAVEPKEGWPQAEMW